MMNAASSSNSDNSPNTEHVSPIRLPLALLIILCVLPWLWAWLGLDVFQDYRITVALYELFGCLVPVLVLRLRKPSFALRLDSLWLIYFCLTILVFTGVLVTSAWLGPALIDIKTFPLLMSHIKLEPQTHFWAFALYFVTINPLVEELFWRGLIFEAFLEHFPVPTALLISSFFFGGWHFVITSHVFAFPWSILTALMVMLGGILFGWSYYQSKSLLPAILIHGLGGDLALVVLAYQLFCMLHLM